MADAVKMAVEKNLDLRVEQYNPAQQEAEYQKSIGIYNPLLQLTSTYNYDNSTGVQAKTTQLNAGVSQLLFSGATATLGFNNNYLDSNQYGQLSGWQSSLGLTLSQPLLKSFGREATELTIDTARISKHVSLETLNTKLISLVAQVRTEYYKLYSLREELEVRKVSLELARRVLSDTQARVKAGIMPAMEILNAEFGMASREKDIIDAELALRNQVDLLVYLLQLPSGSMIEIVEVPSKEPYEVSEEVAIKQALVDRSELKGLKRNVELLELQARVAGNKTLPDLLFSASAATVGLGTTYPRDMDRLSAGNYPSWGVGLTFSYPLGNKAAENEYRKNRLKVEQAVVQVYNQEALIANDVRSAVRAIASNYKQLNVTNRGRAFAEERLRAFVKKVEVGLATTKDLLDVENDLANAKNNQILAQVAYANAITQLWMVTGDILAKEQIRLQPFDPDVLYKGVQ
jgi:outer membrane protein TolC